MRYVYVSTQRRREGGLSPGPSGTQTDRQTSPIQAPLSPVPPNDCLSKYDEWYNKDTSGGGEGEGGLSAPLVVRRISHVLACVGVGGRGCRIYQ